MLQGTIPLADGGAGVHDAYALALLANSPEIMKETATANWANARLRALITRMLLDLLGKQDIPLAAGEDPLPGRSALPFGFGGHRVLETKGGLSVSKTPAAQSIESLIK